MKINKDTNIDRISSKELVHEARMSKNRARVHLLCEAHNKLEETTSSTDTAYGYDPALDMSFTGEFEALGA
jgi:hypothetical protein